MGINLFISSISKCKFLSRPLQERQSLLTLSQRTPLRTLRLRFKIKKVFPQISKDSSSLESNSKMEELSLITTSRRNPHSIWSSDLEVVVWDPSRLNQPSLPWLESSRPRR